MSWKKARAGTSSNMSRERALNTLARSIQRKTLNNQEEQAVRTLVKLLVEAENKPDAQPQLDALLTLARKRGDTEYLTYAKKTQDTGS